MAALNPELALRYLKEMSADIREAVLLDGEGHLEAATVAAVPSSAHRLVAALVEQADRFQTAAGEVPDQIEVASPEGEVFCVRASGRTLVAVTGRFALPALMFYDMRTVLRDLSERGSA